MLNNRDPNHNKDQHNKRYQKMLSILAIMTTVVEVAYALSPLLQQNNNNNNTVEISQVSNNNNSQNHEQYL